jgi:hypothetical protein
MSPAAIVQRAASAGLNALAIADHNCAFNLPAFAAVCDRLGMACLYGIEVTSMEEAHILCLFDQLDAAVAFGDKVYESLPPVKNRPERFGDQPIIDEEENITGFAEKFLISASPFDIGMLVQEVHGMGGLIIPAHIDRQVFGIVAQLGFLPDEDFDAVELTAYGNPSLAKGYPIVRNSDSHSLSSIGTACTQLELEGLCVEEVRASLRRNEHS